MITSEKSLLKRGLEQLEISVEIADSLLIYLQLLLKWNRAYNLTAIREPEQMITLHLLDSLAILPFLNGASILDVGTGAGLPGIPLAIARPELKITLLDSNGKKTSFLEEVKRHLNLSNLNIVQSRVENYHPIQGFDTVVSRAFSELQQMLKWTGHLLAENGVWLAMKGRIPEDELNVLSNPFQVCTYQVPGLDSERCCIIISN